MFVIIGIVMVTGCVLGGYMALGGKLGVLNQPFELVIIGGAGLGAFIIANPMKTIKRAMSGMGAIFKGAKYKKDDYLELLTMQYQVYKLIKQKGALAVEQHVENPHDSSLFQAFPKFHADHHALDFMCDYLRMITMGTDNPHELETLIDQELELHHHAEHEASHALTIMAEGFPGLGIVAAVLGVIKTMGAISEPAEVLGGLIAAALVGTFLGILLCYGYVAPMAGAVKAIREEEHTYFLCLKAGLLAHLSGYAPAISVEFARKALAEHMRPTFVEVEEACEGLPPV